MPSIKKKFKRLSFSKKRSKSTSDLPEEPSHEDGDHHVEEGQDPETTSQHSEAASVSTDISEVTVGPEGTDSEKKAKKRRKFRTWSFGRKSRKNKNSEENQTDSIAEHEEGKLEPLVETSRDTTEADSGVERTLDSTTVTDGSVQNNADESSSAPTESSAIGSAPNPDVDQWRMSGLLDTVDRSNHSVTDSPQVDGASDNLVISFEKRRGQQDSIQEQPASTSTPKDISKHPSKSDNDRKDSGANSQASGADTDPQTENKSVEDKDDDNLADVEEKERTTKVNITSHPVKVTVKVGVAATPKEEQFVETEGLDYEYASDVHSNGVDGNKKPNGNLVNKKQVSEEDISEIRKTDDKDAPDLPNGGTFHDKSVTCDLGKGKTVIIRHMDEVLNDGNIDMPKDVSANDWLVVNLAKDDWVIVDYRKENEEVVEVLDSFLLFLSTFHHRSGKVHAKKLTKQLSVIFVYLSSSQWKSSC